MGINGWQFSEKEWPTQNTVPWKEGTISSIIISFIYYYFCWRVTVFGSNIQGFCGLAQVKGILVQASFHFFLYTFGIYFYCEKLELLEKVEGIFSWSESDFKLK
jgi:hypothetical protein